MLSNLLLTCGDIHPNPGPTINERKPPFTFCHINARSILTVNDTGPRLDHIAQEFTIDKHFDVIAVSESHLGPQITDNEISLPNYQIFRKDRNRRGGGVCVYVNDCIAVTRLPDLEIDNIEIVWLKLNFNGNTIYFGTCYSPPGQSIEEITYFLETLENHISEILRRTPNHMLILTGDFNDRTTEWHSPHTDSELGPHLYNLIHSLHLSQLITEPTRNHNILDLLITNNPTRIIESGVLDPIHDLDHLPIYGILNMNLKHNKPFSRKMWHYSAGNYDDLNNQLSQIPWGIVIGESDDVDDAVDMLTNLIFQCCDNYPPQNSQNISFR